MRTYIYALTEPFEEDKIRYIGKSDNPWKRHTEHIRESVSGVNTKKCKWIHGLVKKGLVPELIIIDEVELDNWGFWEKHYYELFKSWGFSLLNMSECGVGVTKHHPDTIKKLREISLKKSIRGKDHHNYGKKLTDEHKQKLRLGAITKPRKTKPIYQYDADTLELIKIHNSIKDCSKDLNMGVKKIQELLVGYRVISKGVRKTVKTLRGWIFKREPLA